MTPNLRRQNGYIQIFNNKQPADRHFSLPQAIIFQKSIINPIMQFSFFSDNITSQFFFRSYNEQYHFQQNETIRETLITV